jgi:hypothetical protein
LQARALPHEGKTGGLHSLRQILGLTLEIGSGCHNPTLELAVRQSQLGHDARDALVADADDRMQMYLALATTSDCLVQPKPSDHFIAFRQLRCENQTRALLQAQPDEEIYDLFHYLASPRAALIANPN